MKTIVNTAFEPIRKQVEENNGWSGALYDTEPAQEYRKIMQQMKELDGKKVEIKFNAEMDFLTVKGGTKTGRIKVVEDRIRFYEGRKRSRFYYLDAGLFMGWFATLCPTEINVLN